MPGQSRAIKDAPLGWKWCSCCGETKRLSEFGTGAGRPPKVHGGVGLGFSATNLSRWNDRNRRPKSRCKDCCAKTRRKTATPDDTPEAA